MENTRLTLGLAALVFAAPSAAAQSAASSSPPSGTLWELQSVTVNGTLQTPPTALNRPTLSFGAAAISGSGYCNSYRAGYVARNGTLRLTPAATTRRACAAILTTLETQYLKLLGNVTKYTVTAQTLTLVSGSRDTLLFRVQTSPQRGTPASPRPASLPTSARPAPARPTPVQSSTVQPMMVNPAPALSQKGLPPARTLFDRATATLGPDEQLLVVGPQQTACVSVEPQTCLIVKRPAETVWSLFYGAIEGFSYQSGVTTLMRVRVERLSRPAADGSSVRYRLVRILGTQRLPQTVRAVPAAQPASTQAGTAPPAVRPLK